MHIFCMYMQKDEQQYRDMEFQKVFFEELKKSKSVKEAYRNAVMHETSCFFASARYAIRYVMRKENGLDTKITNPTTKRMYEEIYARYKARIRQQRHSDKKKKEIIGEIISSPAPCFYISPIRAKHIIRRLHNEQRRDRKREREP